MSTNANDLVAKQESLGREKIRTHKIVVLEILRFVNLWLEHIKDALWVFELFEMSKYD